MYRLHRMVRFRESSSCRLHSDIFFNEYFNFSVPLRYLDQTHFIFMIILSADAKDPGVPVGRVEVGPYLFARGEELMHWQQAVDNPRTTITMFHTINSPEVVKMSCCKDWGVLLKGENLEVPSGTELEYVFIHYMLERMLIVAQENITFLNNMLKSLFNKDTKLHESHVICKDWVMS